MKPVLLLALLWTFISPLHAQIANRINFIHLGVNEGLSQNTVFLYEKIKITPVFMAPLLSLWC